MPNDTTEPFKQLSCLSAQARIAILRYGLNKAYQAGGLTDAGEFNPANATAALKQGQLQLSGTVEQIEAQAFILQRLAVFVEKLMALPEPDLNDPATPPVVIHEEAKRKPPTPQPR